MATSNNSISGISNYIINSFGELKIDFSKEINNKVNIFIKNDDGSINKDKCNVIRELFAQASKLNNFYDSQYCEQEYKEEKKN